MAKSIMRPLASVGWLKLAMLASVSSFVAILWLASQLFELHVFHQHIDSQQTINNAWFGADTTPKALFLNAYLLNNQGLQDKALANYAKVVAAAKDDNRQMADAHFNSGNTYLKLATERLEQEGLPGWDVAGPLVALAKESYQKALRIYPAWSEAKYNYQLALRLAPTSHGMRGPQQYEDENIKQEEKPSGWPAMPGNPRGMP